MNRLIYKSLMVGALSSNFYPIQASDDPIELSRTMTLTYVWQGVTR